MDQLSAQALIVYKAILDEVGFLKKQQWIITNYVVLIYGAIYAFAKGQPTLSNAQKYLLSYATLIAFLFGVIALSIIQYQLSKAKIRVDEVNRLIFRREEYVNLQMRNDIYPYIRGLEFTISLALVLLIGAVILFLLPVGV
jgi:hypothetical protein